MNKRIFLSHADIHQKDISRISDHLWELNSRAYGSKIDLFENELSQLHKVPNVVAVSSGTAAIHLALIALKIGPGDNVVVPTLTFAATAFPISYVGALPVFMDVDERSWTLDLTLLESYLNNCKKPNLPKLIISVDLFGRTCDYDQLFRISDKFEIPVLIDSAESLGSKYKDTYSASLGDLSILSFNFNKLITTTGGGALLTGDAELAQAARKLANQSRENVHWYEHTEIGYNYRMSSILATLGLSQLERFAEIIEKRRKIRDLYNIELLNVEGVKVNMDSPWELSNAWLSTVTFDRTLYPNAKIEVRERLEKDNIESRYIWKPLHLQPVFAKSQVFLTGMAEKAYEQSLCLPSGNDLSSVDIKNICNVIKEVLK
jgi:dTDP-4-amino-4,6-dideoxygalactose transaminase